MRQSDADSGLEPLTIGARARLSPVGIQHYQLLQSTELTGSPSIKWRWGGGTPSPEAFVSALWSGVLVQHIVEDAGSAEPLGLVTTYDYNQNANFAHVAGVKFDLTDRSTTFVEGAILHLSHVFKCWPVNKLYMEVPEFNMAMIAGGLRRMFVRKVS